VRLDCNQGRAEARRLQMEETLAGNLVNRNKQKKRFFSYVRIPNDFKCCVLEVRILKKLWADFLDVRITKEIGVRGIATEPQTQFLSG